MLDEHLGYITDAVRTELFRQAVARTVSPGDLVIDAGCGFGVLGLLCLQAGAAHVWGIDRTAAIEIARESMDRAGLADRYTCLRESTAQAELPQPVDLIICDHVGFFGIDYGIAAMLGDLRRRMLKPGGQIMPRRIRMIIAGAASPASRAEAEAWSASAIPPEFHWLREYGVNSRQARLLEPGDIRTAPVEVAMIDLMVDAPEHFAFKAQLSASADGVLDGLAGWFECELAEGLWMTNSPLAPERIDRKQIVLPFDQPLPVQAGDVIEASISIRPEDGLMAWSAHLPRTGQRQKQSNWRSMVLSPAGLARGET